MLTNAQADATYQEAFAVLHGIVIDPAATAEQVALAREKRDMLTLDFIGQAIASIEERTKKFRDFIDDMNAVIAEFGSNSLLDGVRRLKSLVDTAGQLIGAALPRPTAAKKRGRKQAGKVARRRHAVKKSAKSAKKSAKEGASAVKKMSAKAAFSRAVKKVAAKSGKRKPASVAKRPVAAPKAARNAAKRKSASIVGGPSKGKQPRGGTIRQKAAAGKARGARRRPR